ncbi:MAG: coenzyme F420-0:L-glutamate ligase [Dehalococcoidia bacterium]|nr:coenzyme F420-0:L-glutamate ligase [Dehalococcoidia bacterium]
MMKDARGQSARRPSGDVKAARGREPAVAAVPALHVFGVTDMPEVRSGSDLAALIIEALARQKTPLLSGDVVVVTQKVVSKAEGQLVRLGGVRPSAFARYLAGWSGKDARRVEVVLRETRRIVKMDQGLLVCETHHGLVCADAGVDESNVPGPSVVTLLPKDPDASARRLRETLERHYGVPLAVVISDTFGRPWRKGITNVAIGASGIQTMRDYKGEKDPSGYVLKGTVIAVADELAASAELVMGKLQGVPVAVVRGYDYERADGGAREMVWEPDHDLFR